MLVLNEYNLFNLDWKVSIIVSEWANWIIIYIEYIVWLTAAHIIEDSRYNNRTIEQYNGDRKIIYEKYYKV